MARDGDGRADPDQLLKAIQMDATGEADGSGSEGDKRARGHLKIFFGYAAGVGKTYAMLTAAHAAQRRGVDVVAGYIEPHRRPDTQALIAGLEILPLRKVRHHDITLEEFDIDAALRRAPQLILVDELAHTNAPGSRHEKRYQDVEELLRRGIDVYTTVNVQHIESLNDIVASITGVIVRERIPDTVFDRADQVELVDIEPADLLERLKAGNVYEGDRAERAMGNFFTVENLTALREIALRRCADRTGRLAAAARLLNNRDYHTSEHTLVCLSSSPSNPRIVRSAARMANAFHGQFTALFVETPAAQSMSDEDRARLQANMRLAEELGATVETVQGDDVALQIAEFARLSGVSEVVLGRAGSVGSGVAQLLTGKKTLVDQLITIAPNLDVHIIPDHKPIDAVSRKIGEGAREAARQELGSSTGPSVRDLVVTCLLLALSTGVGLFFQRLGFSSSSIISLYILVTLLTAVSTAGRLYTLLSSALSVALYNFFFVMPTMTFMTFDSSYLVTFAIMFVTAMVASELTTRISNSARQSAKAAYRTRVLLETNRLLQEADDADDTAKTGMRQLVKLLGRDIVYYPSVKGRLGEPVLERAASTHGHADVLTENERAVAAWVLANNKRAGASTTTLPEAQCLYLAVRRDEQVFGVVGISLGRDRLDGTEQSISLSIVGECALAISRDIEAHERQEAAVLAKNEQLRGNLLRSIGHDLRTPLMAISGSAGILREENGRLAPTKRRQLLDNIYSNSLWLIDMVQNLLTVTHIEDGTVHLNLTSELVDDVLRESVSHLTSDAEQHEIEVVPSQGFLMAKMDVNLVVQVISNLVTNAVKYTPVGSHIRVSAQPEGDMVRIVVADDGPGVADVDKPHIFDRFYTRADGKSGDSHRSFGLGLALCRSIVELHKGTIEVHDNKPHGAVFSFTLPAEEVDIHHDEQ